MTNKCEYSSFKVAVGTSTKKDAYAAGKEVAESTLKRLGCKPKLVFLFCTIHYAKKNGLKQFLNGVWSVLEEGTILVGGTIAGFQNQDGCFARGATILAINYPHMSISVGYGTNVRRNHKKAARKCYKMLKKDLKDEHENKMLFSFISSAEGPEVTSFGSNFNVNSKILGRLTLPLFYILQKVFQKGLGTEQEFLEVMKKYLPDYYFLHSSTIDSINYGTSYQFFDKKVLAESGIALAIDLDIKTEINYELAADIIGIDFKVTKISRNKKIIKKINDKPALKELMKLMEWPSEDLKQNRWLTNSLIYPMGFYKNNKIICRGIAMILGNYLGCFGKVENENIFMLKLSQSKIIESVEKTLPKKEPIMGFLIYCVMIQLFLGIKVFEVNKILKNYFKEKPFLVIYTGGEGMCDVNEEPYFLNESIISTILYED